MKKTVLLLAIIWGAFTLNAQTLVISNGEDTGKNWWQVGSTAVEIVDWHPHTGINLTDSAMAIWISTNSDQWSGGGLSSLNIDVSTYNTISVLIYKNVTGNVQLELQDGTNNYYLQADYTTPGEWQKLEYSIPSGASDITTILIAPFINYDLSTLVGEESRAFWDEMEAFNKVPTSVQANEISTKIISTEVYTITGSYLGKNIDVNSLSKGIYIIKGLDEKGNISAKKVSVK